MTARDVLVAAKAIALRDPVVGQLAVSATGERVKPASALAVRWSSTGAVCRVAFNGDPGQWAPIVEAGHEAVGFLYAAASEHGFWSVVAADEAGTEAVARMFTRAIALADEHEPQHRRERTARGSHPRGVEAT